MPSEAEEVFLDRDEAERNESQVNAQQSPRTWVVGIDGSVLVTGAAGFIGRRVVQRLVQRGFRSLRCLVRPSSDVRELERVLAGFGAAPVELVRGNLLSRSDCASLVKGAQIILHLVTGRGKSFPACFQNSVVATRNLLDAAVAEKDIQRFVNVSSFAVYSNMHLRHGAMLDETCEVERNLEERHDAYVYAKVKQDELVADYRERHGLPSVTVRPCVVFGPGRRTIPGVVGLDTFGPFLHLGGGNLLPLTFVDNCADAIVLAGLVPGIEGRVYNVVDDDLPTSREFLRHYKAKVRGFRSFPVPYPFFYAFCLFWERYLARSAGLVPPVFNRGFCSFHWKGHRYSNKNIKRDLGWRPEVPMKEALERYFTFARTDGDHNA
jgi:nucleoside-diphosphate-sugar epimerase